MKKEIRLSIKKGTLDCNLETENTDIFHNLFFYPAGRIEKRPDEETIEKLRREQKEKLAKMNRKSDEEVWREIREVDSVPPNVSSLENTKQKAEIEPPVQKETPNKPKSIEFNTTLEDVCVIDDRVQDDSAESEPEEPLTCKFTWSKMSKPSYSNEKNTYLTPWDIGKNYKIRCEERKQSILKKTAPGTISLRRKCK